MASEVECKWRLSSILRKVCRLHAIYLRQSPRSDSSALKRCRTGYVSLLACSRISFHNAFTSSISVSKAPIEIRTIQRPSRIAGVR